MGTLGNIRGVPGAWGIMVGLGRCRLRSTIVLVELDGQDG